MEPECLLPHSQQPSTCPYPQPNQSSPCLPIPSWRSILILSSHLLLGLASGLFPSGLLTTTLYAPLLFLIRATCPAHRNVFYLITQVITRDQYRSWCSSVCSRLHCRVISFLLGPSVFLSTLLSSSSLSVRDQVSYPYKTTGKITSLISWSL